MRLQREIEDLLPDGHDCIALVYGGATKIKGYVFEAPKLPEIRGASALLDWVNEVELLRIWGVDVTSLLEDEISQKLVEGGIIYASGGNILVSRLTTSWAKKAHDIEAILIQNRLVTSWAFCSFLRTNCGILTNVFGKTDHDVVSPRVN